MTFTWVKLKAILREFSELPLTSREVQRLVDQDRARRADGSRMSVDENALRSGCAKINLPPLDTTFLVLKFDPARTFFIRRRPRFIVCIGRLSEDIWFIKDMSVDFDDVLRLWDLEYEEIEQAWCIATGKPIALTWMTSPA